MSPCHLRVYVNARICIGIKKRTLPKLSINTEEMTLGRGLVYGIYGNQSYKHMKSGGGGGSQSPLNVLR